MFHRYTEKARRVVFFARYEASQFGASNIDTHHLLLGILREYPMGVSAENLRTEIEQKFPKGPQTPTSEDMPLSPHAKRVLELAAEQADAMGHLSIEGGHLLLAILLLDGDFVGELLRNSGIDEEFVKSKMQEAPTIHAALPFLPIVRQLAALGNAARNPLSRLSEDDAARSIGRNGWSRKQAVGNLIDWATTHHQWFARALVETNVNVPGYPDNEWARAQDYEGLPWSTLVETWLSMNFLLVHVLGAMPAERASVLCKVGVEDPVPLSKLATDYAAHCGDLLRVILKRG